MRSGCGPAAVDPSAPSTRTDVVSAGTVAFSVMRLGVLGPIVLDGVSGEVAVPGAKARQILTVLALWSPESMTLDRLIDVVWTEPPPAAAKTVQSHISRLRRALADAGAPGSLTGAGADYALELGDRLDTHVVAQLARRADAARAGGDAPLAAELYGQARELWRGELELPDTPGGEALRRAVGEQRLELAIAHLGALTEAGAADRAVAELGELVATDPFNERLWELRILALYRSGRPTEALRAVRDATRILAEEVGVVPGPGLRNLESAILAHDESLAATTVPAPVASTNRPSDIGYALAGRTHVAYRCFGTAGPPVLLLNPGMISIDALLEEPHLAGGVTRLADRRRVVAFDPRGIGLSDRAQPPETITIDDWVDDACAVLDRLDIHATHVFTSGPGGLVALTLAARLPERVRSLTLVNPFARFTTGDGYPYGIAADTWATMQTSMQSTDPTPGVDNLTLVSPSVASDPHYRAWWDSAGRRAASPATASTLVSTITSVDLRHLVPEVTAPSLVVVRRGCPAYDPGHGEFVAEHLPNVTVIRQHDVNEPWWIGDTNFILAAFEHFLTSLPPTPAS